MSGTSGITAHLRRRREAAERVRNSAVPGHSVTASMDYTHAFNSRPGSADWKARCTCGWQSAGWYYGEVEALASADRHIKAAAK